MVFKKLYFDAQFDTCFSMQISLVVQLFTKLLVLVNQDIKTFLKIFLQNEASISYFYFNIIIVIICVFPFILYFRVFFLKFLPLYFYSNLFTILLLLCVVEIKNAILWLSDVLYFPIGCFLNLYLSFIFPFSFIPTFNVEKGVLCAWWRKTKFARKPLSFLYFFLVVLKSSFGSYCITPAYIIIKYDRKF